MSKVLLHSNEDDDTFYSTDVEGSLERITKSLIDHIKDGKSIAIVHEGGAAYLWVEDWSSQEIAEAEAENYKDTHKLH